MKRVIIALASGSIAMLASPAMAAVTISNIQFGSAAAFAGPATGVTIDFEGANPAGVTIGAGTIIATGPSNGNGAQPAFGPGNSNHYIDGLDGQPGTVSYAPGFFEGSLFWGSIDDRNELQFFDAANTLLGSIHGYDLSPPATSDGNQGAAASNVRVFFTSTDKITALKFVNHGSPAFEADNINLVSAVPEPATWAMMLVGFGAMGGALRTNRRRSTTAMA